MHKNQLLILLLLFQINIMSLFSQTSLNVLWNKDEDRPIPYATIKGIEDYAISNEDGVFEFKEMNGKITIQNVIYQSLEVDYGFLKANDTIYMKPLIFELDEVVINDDGLYTNMLKTVLTDYALEPHKEKFFLRTVIRKDGVLNKIIDFSGLVEKKSLFDTKQKPMPKNNYKVQIDNMRKVGLQGRNHNVKMFSFKEFFTYLIRLSFSKNDFVITYESTSSKDSKKITLESKNKEKTSFNGYYIIGSDNTFREVNITYTNNSLNYKTKADIKYRTTKMNWKSNFEKNIKTGKLQLKKGKIDAELELIANDIKEIYHITYIYSSNPLDDSVKIKNNINLKNDMFKLKRKYNPNYWKGHKILTLTEEMQEFINKVKASGKNSDFKIKTNMK